MYVYFHYYDPREISHLSSTYDAIMKFAKNSFDDLRTLLTGVQKDSGLFIPDLEQVSLDDLFFDFAYTLATGPLFSFSSSNTSCLISCRLSEVSTIFLIAPQFILLLVEVMVAVVQIDFSWDLSLYASCRKICRLAKSWVD